MTALSAAASHATPPGPSEEAHRRLEETVRALQAAHSEQSPQLAARLAAVEAAAAACSEALARDGGAASHGALAEALDEVQAAMGTQHSQLATAHAALETRVVALGDDVVSKEALVRMLTFTEMCFRLERSETQAQVWGVRRELAELRVGLHTPTHLSLSPTSLSLGPTPCLTIPHTSSVLRPPPRRYEAGPVETIPLTRHR